MDQVQTPESSEVKNSYPKVEQGASDDDQLAALGHVQELRREFSIWSIWCLQISLMATWEAVSTASGAALQNGGPVCLLYNYLTTFIGTIFVALSLAEISSIYPTAGGQYHWVYCISPASFRKFATWFTGWLSIGGQLVLTASAGFSAGLQLQGLITLNHLETYIPQRWQGMLFYFLIILYSAMVNIFGSKVLPHTNMIVGILHIIGFVAIVICLGVMSEKHSTAYVFTNFSNTSGWKSDAASYLVGLISAVYPFLGYDAACHLSEELPKPSRNVPLAMITSTLINGITGLIYVIVMLYALGDLNDLLQSPIGFPFMQLYLNVTKSRGGASVMSLVVSLVAVAANAAGCTSTSRTAWAFARDEGLPCSQFLSVVNPKFKVPVRMIVVVTTLQILLGLIYLASSTAFNAVLSMAILGMYASYLSPICFMLLYGRKSWPVAPSGHNFGPFQLGRYMGPVINAVSIIWLIIAMIFSTFPTLRPVTPENMNYCIVVTVGWIAIGAFYYFLGGKTRFKGPVIYLTE